jgi:hypothetical protein
VKWATRRNCHVDRAACAWLIRRFIEPDPEFLFVDDPDEIPVGTIAFDIRGAALSHHAGNCSFEAFLEHYDLDDEALRTIARIVHDADLEDERYHESSARGVDVLIRGLSMIKDDESLLQITDSLFDGLYEHSRRVTLVEPEA